MHQKKQTELSASLTFKFFFLVYLVINKDRETLKSAISISKTMQPYHIVNTVHLKKPLTWIFLGVASVWHLVRVFQNVAVSKYILEARIPGQYIGVRADVNTSGSLL